MKINIPIKDMYCEQCEKRIEKEIKSLNGIKSVKASLKDKNVIVDFDENKISKEDICLCIENTGYSVGKNKSNIINGISILIIIFALWYIINILGFNSFFQKFPVATQEMNYIMLFIIGFFTSFHCIAMCGGLTLASSFQNTKALKSAFLYNIGRLCSYSIIGGVLGLLGSVVNIDLKIKAIIGIIISIIMIFMGIKIMNCFPFINKLRLPNHFKLRNKLFKKNNSSFYIGLINGFMPCGPLQTMQLLAISAGSFIIGFLQMFFFCLGTIPLLFIFSIIAGSLKSKWKNIMPLIAGAFIIIFGLYNLQNNLALSGININNNININTQEIIESKIIGNEQIVEMDLKPGTYDIIKVKTNIPVKWIINVDHENLNGCNSEIIIPEYNLSMKLKEGENIISFTPNESGTISYSCWMGMIRSQIIIND